MGLNTPQTRGWGSRHCACATRAILVQAIGAAAEEFEETKVAEDLELLADFVAEVRVIRVELCEGVGVSVHVVEGEVHFA